MNKKNKSEQTCDNINPGDLTKDEYLDQLIRVNHAGEYGAKRIYQGQMDVLKGKSCFETIKHMAEQEEIHLEYFTQQMNKRNVRPSILSPLWHVAGYALGAGTAMLGEKAAMACTVAVEEVIDEHYAQQYEKLGDDEIELKNTIEKFRKEELEHKDLAIENNAEDSPCYEVLSGIIKIGSKLAIALAKRF